MQIADRLKFQLINLKRKRPHYLNLFFRIYSNLSIRTLSIICYLLSTHLYWILIATRIFTNLL